MEGRNLKIRPTREIPKPNYYILALDGEFKDFAYNEERVQSFKGEWRSKAFGASPESPIDVEIGTGNGNHFAHHAKSYPQRNLIGLELKYKPLIQTIRRTLNNGSRNARVTRFHAHNLDMIFAPGEIDNVYIHFPDPWERPKKFKNRIVSEEFLERVYNLQKPGSFIEFKTDSREYYLWARDQIAKSKYKVEFETLNLHSTQVSEKNFITSFERIFMRQGIEINYIKLIRQ